MSDAAPISDRGRWGISSSKMDPLVAKDEPVSDDGSASVVTHLRKAKN